MLNPVILALAAVIVIAPLAPTWFLMLLDNFLVRIAVVAAVLFAVTAGPAEGLLALMVVGALFLERNRRKVAVAQQKIDLMDQQRERPATVAELGESQTTVPVRRFDTEEDLSLHFLPGDDMGSDQFHPVGGAVSLNAKEVFEGVPNGSAAASIFESEGYGHVGL